MADAAFEYHPYHFGLTVGGTFAHYQWSQTQLVGTPINGVWPHYQWSPTPLIGVPPVNNTDRNDNEYEAYAKLDYEFSPGYAIFARATDRSVEYTRHFDRNGLQRDNHGYRVDVGLDAEVTHLLVGSIFAGYLDEHYHAPLLNISGFDFGANLDWSVTPLWTLHLTATRTLNSTTLNNASAEDNQSVRLSADFNPRDDIVINGYVGYIDSNFNSAVRHDTYTLAGIGLSYYMNRNVSAKLGYDYQLRNSSVTGQGYHDNTVSIGLQLQL